MIPANVLIGRVSPLLMYLLSPGFLSSPTFSLDLIVSWTRYPGSRHGTISMLQHKDARNRAVSLGCTEASVYIHQDCVKSFQIQLSDLNSLAIYLYLKISLVSKKKKKATKWMEIILWHKQEPIWIILIFSSVPLQNQPWLPPLSPREMLISWSWCFMMAIMVINKHFSNWWNTKPCIQWHENKSSRLDLYLRSP